MSALPFKILTVIGRSEFIFKEKGSEFIGITFPVSSEFEANQRIKSIKKEYHNASHHCYSINLANGFFKYSDAGEPNGSAGIRIFNAQSHFNLTNILTVVVRYFGGIKLGIGPLGKAYYESAFKVLESSKKEEQILISVVDIKFNFNESKIVRSVIKKFNMKEIGNSYDEQPKISCNIEVQKLSDFESEMMLYPKIIYSISPESKYYSKRSITQSNS